MLGRLDDAERSYRDAIAAAPADLTAARGLASFLVRRGRLNPARDVLREAPGLIVIDKRDSTGYMTPKEAQGEHPVFVSRIRKDPTVEHGLNLWVVADNLRKGAALNAVQIAELLHERGLIRQKALA